MKFVIILWLLIMTTILGVSAFASEYERPMNTTITNIVDDNCAELAALNGIPGISHHQNHTKHYSVGFGVGNCGDSAIAIGINHHREDQAFKLGIGKGDDLIFSGGASFGF